MEGHVNTRERNSCEAALESDVSLLRLELLCLREAGVDDLAEHLLDLLHCKSFSKLFFNNKKKQSQYCDPISDAIRSAYLRDVNLFHLEIIENVSEGLKRDELSCANVLLTLPNEQNTQSVSIPRQ